MEYTPAEAIEYFNKGELEKWVHKFLNGPGGNKKLLDIMENNGVLTGPKKIYLTRLERTCGPEAEMIFHETEQKWSDRIKKMVKAIEHGWTPPPLIAWDMKGRLSIADGSHRIEALKIIGAKEYWTIVWQGDPKINK